MSAARQLAIVRLRDRADGEPTVELDRESPLMRQVTVRPIVTVAVAAPVPFTSLQVTGQLRSVKTRNDAMSAFRLSPLSLRFVGSTAAAVPLGAFCKARPGPLWRQAPQILAHLERAHAADLLACIHAHGWPQVELVSPRALDRYGLQLALVTASGICMVRLPFPAGPVESLTQVGAGLRTVLTCRCGVSPQRNRDS